MNSRLIAVPPDNELDYVKSAANISDVRTNGVGVLDHDNRYVNVIGAILGWAELRPERNRYGQARIAVSRRAAADATLERASAPGT